MVWSGIIDLRQHPTYAESDWIWWRHQRRVRSSDNGARAEAVQLGDIFDFDSGGHRAKGDEKRAKSSGQRTKGILATRFSEDDGKHKHLKQRLDNGPSDAHLTLRVADFDIAPDKEPEQVAVVVEFSPVHQPPAGRAFDHDFREGTPVCWFLWGVGFDGLCGNGYGESLVQKNN